MDILNTNTAIEDSIQTALIIAAVSAMAVSALLIWRLIPVLRKKAGQNIREEGPQSHKKKAGTPSMGGIGIVAGCIAGTLIGIAALLMISGSFSAAAYFGSIPYIVLLAMLFFALMGFSDDYLKVVHKQNLGLTAKHKLLLQIAVGLASGLYFYFAFPEGHSTYLPFINVTINLGPAYILWVCFVMVAMANAVNLTDGLDGLCGSVTAMVAFFFMAAGIELRLSGASVAAAALFGALIGFLFFNRFPAKIFMGDTGSLALGGMLAALALSMRLEWFLVIVGLVYVLEALSVMIQVAYFKKTGGKRFFRMAPLHHHFELGGMKEKNVVLMFFVFTVLMALIGTIGIRLMK